MGANRDHKAAVWDNLVMKVKEIPLDQILDPETPVRTVASEEAMDDLVSSMREFGLLEPVMVIQEGEYYRLIAGHRRLMAARSLGWEKIACNILNVDAQTGALISLEENIKREDVNPYDQALYFLSLIKTYGMTQTDIANKFGFSKQQVHNRMELLKLDPTTIQMIQEKELSATHAIELGRIGDVEVRAKVRAEVMGFNLNVLATRTLVDQVISLGPEITQGGEVSLAHVPIDEAPVGYYKCLFCGAPGRDIVLRSILVCNHCLRVVQEGMEEAARGGE